MSQQWREEMYHPSAPREDRKYGGGISPVIIPPPLTPQGYPPQQRYHSPYSHSHGPDSKGVPVPWSSGLCHCCDDPANCIITAFCPCITFGQIAEIVNKGEPSCVTCGGIYGLVMGLSGLACLFSCCYRSKMRAQYDLEEYPFADCLVHFCCETCALCQEYRELKAHGFDMGIGWEANVDRQKRGIAMVAPGVVQGMSR